MVYEKVILPSSSGDRDPKRLLSVAELKAILGRKRGQPLPTLRPEGSGPTFQEPERRRLKVNGDFFAAMYREAKEQIKAMVEACLPTQAVPKEDPRTFVGASKTFLSASRVLCSDPGSNKPQVSVDSSAPSKLESKMEPKSELRTEQKPESKTERRQTKGTHWEEADKQRFIECFKKYGRDWKAIGQQFPSKTDKQLRNFYQNNKSKLNLHDSYCP